MKINKTYNLKLTVNQIYLVESCIFDLCNHSISDNYSIDELNKFDDSDVFRISIYKKYKRYSKGYYLFINLTKEEIFYISGEISHFFVDGGFERNSREIQMAKRIIQNIHNVTSVEYQRNLILSDILND